MSRMRYKWSEYSEVSWDLTPKQWEVENYINSGGRFTCLTPARRGGKTYYTVHKALRMCMSQPNIKGILMGFTHGHAENVFMDTIHWLAHPYFIADVRYRLPIRIWFKNGSILDLVGSTEVLQAQGLDADFVIVDEIGDQDSKVWYQYLQPLLMKTGGIAILLGSPKGTHSWVYSDIVVNPESDFRNFSWGSLDGGLISPDNIESARRNMPDRLYRQEVLGEWVTSTSVAYAEFDPKLHLSDQEFLPDLPTYVSWDFNVNPMCFGIIQPSLDTMDGFVVVKEFIQENTRTRLCGEFLHNWLESKGFNRFNTPLKFCGDFAGGHRHPEADRTNWEILDAQNIDSADYASFHRRTTTIRDRVGHCNRVIFSNKYKVNKKCSQLIREFSSMEYKQNGLQLDDKHGSVGHTSDWACYFPWNYMEVEDQIANWEV